MIQKIIVLTAIISAVWYGFKFIGRLDAQRKAKLATRKAEAVQSVTETVQCSVCDAYVNAAAPNNCGQTGCPY
ncbi:MAG: hypothetical protein ACKVKG_15070 [Alphaproteobacteria bacterium]|jgi:hypothetical protein